MPLSVKKSSDGKLVTIHVDGRFDFNLHREFRDAYTNAGGAGTSYSIDLSATEYMDSSALGMLLLLREHAGSHSASIRIMNCTPEIKKILMISNFNRLFEIQ